MLRCPMTVAAPNSITVEPFYITKKNQKTDVYFFAHFLSTSRGINPKGVDLNRTTHREVLWIPPSSFPAWTPITTTSSWPTRDVGPNIYSGWMKISVQKKSWARRSWPRRIMLRASPRSSAARHPGSLTAPCFSSTPSGWSCPQARRSMWYSKAILPLPG